MVSPPFKLKIFTGRVCVLLTSVSLKLKRIKIKLIYTTTSSWEKKKKKWRVKGKWHQLIFFFFLWFELICFMIRVQSHFIFLFDPSWCELIWPRLVVRVDPVRFLYLPRNKKLLNGELSRYILKGIKISKGGFFTAFHECAQCIMESPEGKQNFKLMFWIYHIPLLNLLYFMCVKMMQNNNETDRIKSAQYKVRSRQYKWLLLIRENL